MVDTEKGKEQDKRATETAPNSEPDYGLLPMLIGGLVLIVVGAIVVMAFV